MLNADLLPLIIEYQKGNMKNFNIIYDEFEKLMMFYSHRLDCEDPFQELNVYFVELLFQVPLNKFNLDNSYGLKKYIAVSIRNKYILLSKRAQIEKNLFIEYLDEVSAYTVDYEEEWTLKKAITTLTDKQKRIINKKFFHGYTDSEIAKDLNISRQAVNRLKIRALSTLREFYDNE